MEMKSLLNATSPVTIVANENVEGNPIVTPLLDAQQNPRLDLNGNPMGSMRLEQTNRSLAGGSFLNVRRRVAFISGTMDNLLAIVAENKFVSGSTLPGKIFVTESLVPFWNGQTAKMNPQTQENITIAVGEREYPVYMRMTYTEDLNTKDTFIRTAEDAMLWLSTRQALIATTQPSAPETAGMPAAVDAIN